ncbi:MAG: hypothetical protein ABI723_27530 [Bacteroidia bacterium]
MNTASLSEVKKELTALKPAEVLACCMRLAKFKKDNKELLSYLLFEAHNEAAYIEHVKSEIDELYSEMNKSTFYLAKKNLRKVLRITNKKIKYSGLPQTEVELLIYFCTKLNQSGIKVKGSTTLMNLYESQLIKINKALAKLHEDLQYDYQKEVEELMNGMKH